MVTKTQTVSLKLQIQFALKNVLVFIFTGVDLVPDILGYF